MHAPPTRHGGIGGAWDRPLANVREASTVYGGCSAWPGAKKGGNTFHDGLVRLVAFRRRADNEVCMFYSGLTEAGLARLVLCHIGLAVDGRRGWEAGRS